MMDEWEGKKKFNPTQETVLVPGTAKPLSDNRNPQLLGVGKRV